MRDEIIIPDIDLPNMDQFSDGTFRILKTMEKEDGETTFVLMNDGHGEILTLYSWNDLQLIYPYFKTWKGILVMTVVSMPATVGYILATKALYTAMDNSLWSVRLIGFSMGVLTFTFLTYVYLKEGLNLKNTVTLIMSIIIVLLQVFWKTK